MNRTVMTPPLSLYERPSLTTVIKVDLGMNKCHVCFFNVCFSLFAEAGTFPNYMLNKDKFAAGRKFQVCGGK